ncbi:MAG: hypothetical protein AB1716_03335 [Planctomycetota bacterium]
MSRLDLFHGHARRRAATLLTAFAIGTGLAATALAGRPLFPLPLPEYSFDLTSPAVVQGRVAAGDILVLGGERPVVLVPAVRLGMVYPQDDLDGLSAPNEGGLPPMFALLFSVDRASRGLAPPHPDLIRLNVPYNMLDQAERGHAAGDMYMGTTLFSTTAGAGGGNTEFGIQNSGLGIPDSESGVFAAGTDAPTMNNVLVANNYNEGGTDFGADPPGHAYSNYGAQLVAQDNVDAFARLTRNAPGGRPIRIYFSLTAESPSLPVLSGGVPPSGANIFFNPDPLAGTTTELYAAFYRLGLLLQDDIDALLVLDTPDPNHPGQVSYGPGDALLFSLDPSSPSLQQLGATAAHILGVRYGQPPQVVAQAVALGLGNAQDDVDALDYAACQDWLVCGGEHGIRFDRGDLNCDGQLDFDDINPFVLAMGGEPGYLAEYPDCNWHHADCNCDGLVTFDDINPFVACLTTGNCMCP